MKGLKVAGMTHLVRRDNAPGVLVNTNTQGYSLFVRARANLQAALDTRDEIEILRDAVAQLSKELKNVSN